MKFPFEPKSTSNLAPGQYWCIPLRSGNFATGVVLAHAIRQGKRDSRLVCVGLLNWVGDAPATANDIADADLVDHGFAHVRSIQRNGSMILGKVEPHWGFEPELNFDRLAGGGISVWGLSFIHYQAELRWGDAVWVKAQLEAQWSQVRKGVRADT
jgi:hypothetical protein